MRSLGDYEKQRYLSEADRKASDERLNLAVTLLCRASGAFEYLGETVLPQLLHGSASLPRVPDIGKEVMAALAK